MDGETMVWMRREGERQEECDFFGAMGLYVEMGNTITSLAWLSCVATLIMSNRRLSNLATRSGY